MICPPIKFKVFLNSISNVYILGLFHGSKAKKKTQTKQLKREERKEGGREGGREGGEK